MEPSNDRQALLLPAGTRLVHIGPSKTGTTSLQAAMWAGGETSSPRASAMPAIRDTRGAAARAAAGLRSPHREDGSPPPIRLWERHRRELPRRARARADVQQRVPGRCAAACDPPIVEDLDPARIHVVMTLRPLARMLASRWQQNVQTGETIAYDAWLQELFNRPDDAPDMPVWLRHRHDRVLTRWAEIVGLERMTVVVVNDQDHAQVLRAFEGLSG